MDLTKFLRTAYYSSAAAALVLFGSSCYNLNRFNTTPGVTQASISQIGPINVRNYKDRREIANSLKPEYRETANKHLDNLDFSNFLLGIDIGLIGIPSGIGLAVLRRKK